MDQAAQNYRRYLDGEEAGFDDLMGELFYPLVFFIHRYVRDLPAAEDLAMDTFADLIVHPQRFDFRRNLKPWLFTIGKNRALDYLRRRRILSFIRLEDTRELSDMEELEEKLVQNQRKRALSQGLEKLSRDRRVALHLVYFADMSYEEAALVMGKSKKQVDNLIYQGKRELRNLLEQEELG